MRNLTASERRDIALTIAGEIDPRFSPYGTKNNRREIAAILGVIENRSTLRNKSLSDIVHEHAQFSTWNTEKDRRTARAHYSKHAAEINKAVDDYFAGYLRSPVPHATQYFSPKGMKNRTEPGWAKALVTRTRVGPHVFGHFKDEPEKLTVAQLARSLPFASAGTVALAGGVPAAAGIGGLSLLSLGKDLAKGVIGAASEVGLPFTAQIPMARPLSPITAPGGLGRLIGLDPATTRSVSSPRNLPDTAPMPTARPFMPSSQPSPSTKNGPGPAPLGPAPRSPMDDVRAKDWRTFSLPPGADPRLSNLPVYSPEGLAARIGETKAPYGDMPSASGHLPRATLDDIDAVMASRAWGPNPAEMAARIAAYKDPANIAAAQTADRLQAARARNAAQSSYTSAATPAATSVRDTRREAIQEARAASQPPNAFQAMLAGMDALGRPNVGAPVEDTRREAIREARQQVRLSPYDRAVMPTRVRTTTFMPDLQPVDRAPAPLASPYQSGTYTPPNPTSPAVRAIERTAPRPQPTIAAPPPNSLPPAGPDMRSAFPPAPSEPTRTDAVRAELGPALRQAIIGGLVGGLPGAAIGLAGGLLGVRTGGLGALGPGFDAAVPSGDRFSTGSGLGGILSAMGGPRGATGYSRSNPGMSYTSLGPGMGGLRRSDRFGWTETVGPGGEVRGISYDNGGGGLLGSLSRGLGSLFGGADGGSKGKGKKSGKGEKSGKGRGYSGNGLY